MKVASGSATTLEGGSLVADGVLLRIAKINRQHRVSVDRGGKARIILRRHYQSALTPNCTMRPSSSVDVGTSVGLVTIAPVVAFTVAVVLMEVMLG